MQKLFFICGLFFLSCNSHTNTIEKYNEEYPKVIDSLGLHKSYNNLKWDMYRLFAEDTLVPMGKLKPINNVTLGTLPIEIYRKSIERKDTLELIFAFKYQDSILHDYDATRNHFIVYGGALSISGDSLFCYINYSCIGAYVNPRILSLEKNFQTPIDAGFIKYLIKNKSKLDPWLKAEVIKRGIIKP